MSNEYKEWLKDKMEDNKILVQKYPFIGDYTYTWLDNLPDGWRSAFGEQLCKDIQEVLDKYNCEMFIMDIKEKYGEMRFYFMLSNDDAYGEVLDVIERYREISRVTCLYCGKPADYVTTGWITPICKHCAKNKKINIEKTEVII